MTNEEKLRETFPKTIFIFQKNGNDETTAIMCSDEWLQRDYDQTYKDSAPCADVVSRADTLQSFENYCEDNCQYSKKQRDVMCGACMMGDAIEIVENLPSVTPKLRLCKDCKFFETDSWAELGWIPLIVAHEICNKWGDGCKTKEDGYCFLFEPKMEGESE